MLYMPGTERTKKRRPPPLEGDASLTASVPIVPLPQHVNSGGINGAGAAGGTRHADVLVQAQLIEL